jgi:hypothetical protein
VGFKLEVFNSQDACGFGNVTLDGQILPQTLLNGVSSGKGSVTTDRQGIVTASWNFLCVNVNGIPDSQLMKFLVDTVDGRVVKDVGFSVLFRQNGAMDILSIETDLSIPDEILANPNPQGLQPLHSNEDQPEYNMEEELAELDYLWAQMHELKHLIHEKERAIAQHSREHFNEMEDEFGECDSLKCIAKAIAKEAKHAANRIYGKIRGDDDEFESFGRPHFKRPHFPQIPFHGRPKKNGTHPPPLHKGNHTHPPHFKKPLPICRYPPPPPHHFGKPPPHDFDRFGGPRPHWHKGPPGPPPGDFNEPYQGSPDFNGPPPMHHGHGNPSEFEEPAQQLAEESSDFDEPFQKHHGKKPHGGPEDGPEDGMPPKHGESPHDGPPNFNGPPPHGPPPHGPPPHGPPHDGPPNFNGPPPHGPPHDGGPDFKGPPPPPHGHPHDGPPGFEGPPPPPHGHPHDGPPDFEGPPPPPHGHPHDGPPDSEGPPPPPHGHPHDGPPDFEGPPPHGHPHDGPHHGGPPEDQDHMRFDGPGSQGPGPHHGPPGPPLNRIFTIVKFTAVGFLCAFLLLALHRRACTPKRRADRQARREERHRRRAYRRMAHKHMITRLLARISGNPSGDEFDDYEEKREALLASAEDGMSTTMTEDITQLRNAAHVVGEMVVAEEGRAMSISPSESASLQASEERPLLQDFEMTMLTQVGGEELPAYEDNDGSEMSSVIADGFRYTPGGSNYSPSHSPSGSVSDILGPDSKS